MSPLALWLCMILFIGSAAATDVPFVFDNNSSNVAGYTTDQLKRVSTSSSDISGVPFTSIPQDNEIIKFPITGGGNTIVGTAEKRVEDLKKMLSSKVEPDNPEVIEEAGLAAGRYSGDYTIEQVSAIYAHLKENWHYLRDPRGFDYFKNASESLNLGKKSGCVGVGDCDDFAILMSALVEAAGGTTRIILALNNATGGHAYTEVYLGQLNAKNNQIEAIINWLRHNFDTNKIYTHIDPDTKEVWLNLDWGADEKGNAHPGGPFYPGDKHFIICIRDTYSKTSLMLPEKTNKPPKLISLSPDKPSPQKNGTAVLWTAEAKDPENDPIQYRFFLNDEPETEWQKENTWTWTSTDYDIGENWIEIRIRDGKHSGLYEFDSNKKVSFDITEFDFKGQEKLSNPIGSPENLGGSRDAEAWNRSGYILCMQEKYDEAIKAFDTALEINPKYANSWVLKGYALGKQGKYDEAIKACNIAIGINPNLTPAWFTKGNLLCQEGRYDEAIKACDKAIETNPKSNGAWGTKATALGKQSKYDEAIKCLDEVIKLDPKDSMAWNNKAALFIDQRKYDEALKCSDQAIKLNPVLALAWDNKGKALKGLGRTAEANSAFSEANELGYGQQFVSSPKNVSVSQGTEAWINNGADLISSGRYIVIRARPGPGISFSPFLS